MSTTATSMQRRKHAEIGALSPTERMLAALHLGHLAQMFARKHDPQEEPDDRRRTRAADA